MAVAIPLTVSIPTYNRRDAVRTLCESILPQLSPGDELIVSDNASTDGTEAALADLSGVTVVAHPMSLGMVGNWNYCLTAGTHDWVCLIHSDDHLLPGGLAAIRRACAISGRPALVAHRAWEPPESFVDDTFWCLGRDPGPSAALRAEFCASGLTLHRAVCDVVGKFNAGFAYSSDMEYFARVCASFPSYVIRNPAVVQYVLHRGNLQLQTWREPDFLDQLRAVEAASIAHAGLPAVDAERLLQTRLTRDVRYILRTLRANGHTRQARRIARAAATLPILGRRLPLAVWLAGHLGWFPERLLN